MEQAQDFQLEMSLMLPIALAGGTQPPKPAEGQLKLTVEQSRRELAIIMQGSADAATLMETLTSLIRHYRGEEGLHLDLTQARGIDHLTLSALVVVLRNQGRRFQRLTLSGLPTWASGRLFSTGAENLLGRKWSENFAPGMVSFYRF
jgi:ABC-type transporter Mla MlaB component